MKPRTPASGGPWELLVRLYFTQRAHLPPLAAELQLSPAQCHVLHLIEPERPIPMGQLAETLACDASNVTGPVAGAVPGARRLGRDRPGTRRPVKLIIVPSAKKIKA